MCRTLEPVRHQVETLNAIMDYDSVCVETDDAWYDLYDLYA